MALTVIGLFDETQDAQKAIAELTDIGIPANQASSIQREGSSSSTEADEGW